MNRDDEMCAQAQAWRATLWSCRDDDLQFVERKQDELFGRIQERTSETRETVEKAGNESSFRYRD